jgi:hypothetical protein
MFRRVEFADGMPLAALVEESGVFQLVKQIEGCLHVRAAMAPLNLEQEDWAMFPER